jgi:hypothetical protein
VGLVDGYVLEHVLACMCVCLCACVMARQTVAACMATEDGAARTNSKVREK